MSSYPRLLPSWRHQQMHVPNLIKECDECRGFFFHCGGSDDTDPDYHPCHHFKLVFTDGACSNNGRRDAVPVSGIGMAMGSDGSQQYSQGVDNRLDPGQRRTNQRAELLAAIRGLELLWRTTEDAYKEGDDHGYESGWDHQDFMDTFVVATDSEYVVKGITEWYPNWERRGWLNSQNWTPSNLDLFHRLDDLVMEIEQKCSKVFFWHISRDYNQLADGLAKDGACSML